MRNGNFLKMRVSEIRVKRIRVNQGLGVEVNCQLLFTSKYRGSLPNATFGSGKNRISQIFALCKFWAILFHSCDLFWLFLPKKSH